MISFDILNKNLFHLGILVTAVGWFGMCAAFIVPRAYGPYVFLMSGLVFVCGLLAVVTA